MFYVTSSPRTGPDLPDAALRVAIRTARRARGWSQQQLTDKLNESTATWPEPFTLTQTGITRMEVGDRGISLNEAVAICELLDLDLYDIIERSGSKHRSAVRARRDLAARLLDAVESVMPR